MDLAELTALLTPDGLRLLDGLPAVESAEDVTRAVSRLRAAGHSPDLVSAVVTQARLRVRARAKFGEFAERMLFTTAGLEQSTRLSIAARHAGRFRDAGMTSVADLGCGIGGDALGFAGLGLRVVAVDADEVTAAIAAYNLAPFADAVTVRHATAEAVAPEDSVDAGDAASDLPAVDAYWLDPARRTAGHSETSRTRPEDWSPALDWVFDLARRVPAGVKLGPGLDRDLIPDDVEAQWVSADGSTIELVLWSGALARDGRAPRGAGRARRHRGGADGGSGCRGRAGPRARRLSARAGWRGDPRAADRRCRPVAGGRHARRAHRLSDVGCGADEPVRAVVPRARRAARRHPRARPGAARARHRASRDQEAGSGCRSRRPAQGAASCAATGRRRSSSRGSARSASPSSPTGSDRGRRARPPGVEPIRSRPADTAAAVDSSRPRAARIGSRVVAGRRAQPRRFAWDAAYQQPAGAVEDRDGAEHERPHGDGAALERAAQREDRGDDRRRPRSGTPSRRTARPRARRSRTRAPTPRDRGEAGAGSCPTARSRAPPRPAGPARARW